MKKSFIFAFLFLFSVGNLFSQEKITETSEEILEKFSSKTESIQWDFPVSREQQVPLIWHKATNSLSNRGIETFVGYEKQQLRAILSIQNGKISGKLFSNEKEIEILTANDGRILIKQQNFSKTFCGNCEEGHCSASHRVSPLQTSPFLASSTSIADDVLRIYRLALPISYEYYSTTFDNDSQKVREFWAQVEIFLNEIYMRDLGVKFQVVDDEKLIIKTDSDPINKFSYNGVASTIIEHSTKTINSLIGEDKYDVGIVIGKNSRLRETTAGVEGLLGLAGVQAVYMKNWKAQAIANAQMITIAHEIGHLFGGEHTHSSNASADAKRVEVGDGQSVMSYGSPMNFFSLVSVAEHIKPFLSKIPYYSDRERKVLVGQQNRRYNNFPFGVKTNNLSPKIEEESLKSNYIIPKNTFFQFKIKAKDPENRKLYYTAQQSDINKRYSGTFLTKQPSEESTILFQTEYEEDIRNYYAYGEYYNEKKYSTPNQTGDFTFWLAATDADLQPNYISRENYATTYDIKQVTLSIKEGTPFVFTNSFEKSYKAGQKIPLTWSVDTNIFPADSRVRILLSDDFGKTFPYTLLENAPNTGSAEVTIPAQITIGTRKINISQIGELEIPAGVFKIEVVDNPAYAVSATRPLYAMQQGRRLSLKIVGGFLVSGPEIEFNNPLPPKEILISCEERTIIPELTARSKSCDNASATISYAEENAKSTCEKYTYKRIWTASDACGNTASFEQIVQVVPNYAPLVFAGELPENQIVSCTKIPEPPVLKAQGGCSEPSVQFSESFIKKDCLHKETLVRTWVATDTCGTRVEHQQIIEILPEIQVFNAVSLEKNSENYFKITQAENYPDNHLIIFNELGQVIFETKGYHNLSNVFRGIANRGVFSKGKKLPEGTYFYFFSYTDEKGSNQTKKGFLYLK